MAIISKPPGDPGDIALLPQTLGLKVYHGDSLDISLRLKDSRRAPLDLTGFTGLVQFRDASDNIVASPEVTINYGDIGIVRIYIADTTNLPVGVYSYDLQLTDANGQRRTVVGGTVTITGDVSR